MKNQHPLTRYCDARSLDGQMDGIFSAIGNGLKNIGKGVVNVVKAPFQVKGAKKKAALSAAQVKEAKAKAQAAATAAAAKVAAANLALAERKAQDAAKAASEKKMMTYAIIGVAGLGAVFLITKIATRK